MGVSSNTPSNVARKKQRRGKTARDHVMTKLYGWNNPTSLANTLQAWMERVPSCKVETNCYRQKNTANPVHIIMGKTVEARNKNGTAKGRL